MKTLTPEMLRVLRVLGATRDWTALEFLESFALLRHDDVMAVPGLIERGLAAYDAGTESVLITTAGLLLLAERAA